MEEFQRYQTIVERRHIWHRQIQVVVVTLVLAVVLGIGIFLGRGAAYSGMDVDPGRYREMAYNLPMQGERIIALERELGIREARNDIDRTALEFVRKEMATQREQILELEESLHFYQSLIAPEGIARGLILRSVEVINVAGAERYAFRIVLQQEVRKHDLLKGRLIARLLGHTGNGVASAFLFSALSEDIDANAIELRFRYFQVIEGGLSLPFGFIPEMVELVAEVSVPAKIEVKEQFPWLVQERFSYVGK